MLMVLTYFLFITGVSVSFYFQLSFLTGFEFTLYEAILVTSFFETGKIFLEIYLINYRIIGRIFAVLIIITLISINVFSLWSYRLNLTYGDVLKYQQNVQIGKKQEEQSTYLKEQINNIEESIKQKRKTLNGLKPSKQTNYLINNLNKQINELEGQKNKLIEQQNITNTHSQETGKMERTLPALITEETGTSTKILFSASAALIAITLELILWLVAHKIGERRKQKIIPKDIQRIEEISSKNINATTIPIITNPSTKNIEIIEPPEPINNGEDNNELDRKEEEKYKHSPIFPTQKKTPTKNKKTPYNPARKQLEQFLK